MVAAAAAVDPIAAAVCSVPVLQRTHHLVAGAEAVWLYWNQTHQKGCSSAVGAAVAVAVYSGPNPRINHLLVAAAVGYFDPGYQIGLRPAAGAVFAAWNQIDSYFVETVGYLHLDSQKDQLTVAVGLCSCSYLESQKG